MPIYEYRCARCGNTMEILQKVSDPPPATCPTCEATGSLDRLVSRTSFQLKGGGWYSDLYGSVKKDGKGNTSDTAAAPASPAEKPGAPATPAAPTAAPAPAKPSGSGTGG